MIGALRRRVALGPYGFGRTRFSIVAPKAVAGDLARCLADAGVGGARTGSLALQVRGDGPRAFRIRRGKESWIRSIEPHELGYSLMSLMDSVVAADWCATGLALHAAVVERDGRALALVGYSGVGKSSLAAAAVRAGYRYLADELALIDDACIVHAYHRPIGIRRRASAAEATASAGRQVVDLVPASSVGSLGEAAPLAALVLVDRTRGAPPAQLGRVAPAEAMATLLNNLPGADGHEEAIFHRVHALVTSIPVLSLTRGPLEAMVERLDEWRAGST